jgi:hypothetical protein
MAFGQEGRKAIVYQTRSDTGFYALKIFKPQFRDVKMVDTSAALASLYAPGLEVCRRECLTRATADSLVNKYPEMEYAVLMPWVHGSTWFDIIAGGAAISKDASQQIAKNAADVLAGLEQLGYAHCDIAGGNIVVNLTTGRVDLIDVEDMHGKGLMLAGAFPQGTDGYQHCTGPTNPKGQWCGEGDRFAAAVLFAEMLAWHRGSIRKAADEEHFFSQGEMQKPDSQRYELMVETLKELSRDVADAFERAWRSKLLSECPTLAEWAKLLDLPYVSEWLPIAAPPPAAPYAPQTWTPITVAAPKEYKPDFIGIPPSAGFSASGAPIAFAFPAPAYLWWMGLTGSPDCSLHWLSVPGAEGYELESDNDPNFATARAIYRGPDTAFVDRTHGSSARYYRVRACGTLGVGDWSKQIKVMGNCF